MRITRTPDGLLCVDGVSLCHDFSTSALNYWVKDIQSDDPDEDRNYYFISSHKWEKVRYTKEEYREILVYAIRERLSS